MARRRHSNRRHRRGSFGFLYKVLSMLVICGAIVAAMTLFFRVDTIVVTGQQRYTQEEVVSATGIQPGDNLFLLNKYSVANSIAKELSLGAVIAILARFAAHFVSGYLLFSGWAEWFFTQEGFTLGNSIFAALGNGTPLYMLYSLMYNGSYLIPEMIITAVVAYILGKQKFFEKLVGETK